MPTPTPPDPPAEGFDIQAIEQAEVALSGGEAVKVSLGLRVYLLITKWSVAVGTDDGGLFRVLDEGEVDDLGVALVARQRVRQGI